MKLWQIILRDRDSYLLFPEGSNVLNARCRTCHFSVALPAEGSFMSSFDTIMDSMRGYEVRVFVILRFHLPLLFIYFLATFNFTIPSTQEERSNRSTARWPFNPQHTRNQTGPFYPSVHAPSSSSLTPVRPTMNSMTQPNEPMTPVSLGKRKMEEPGPGTMLPNYLGFNPALNMYNAQAPVPAGPPNMPNPYEFNGLVVRSGIPQAQPFTIEQHSGNCSCV